MNKSNITMAASILMFLIVLLLIKTQMDRNRQVIPQELDKSIQDMPGKLAQEAARGQEQSWSNKVVTNDMHLPQTNDALGTLFNMATKVGRGVDQIGLNATQLTDNEEMEFGQKLDKEILKDMPEDSDLSNIARLNTLAKGLVSQCQRKQIRYHFRIVKSKTVNAFSIAGGYVYITTAFLKRFPSDAELAMTLGHEMGHVELKHCVHKVQYEYQSQKVLGEVGSIVQLGYGIFSSPFTKEQEYDADAWGFAACKNAGWNSDKLLLLFENLEKYEQENRHQETEPSSEFERRIGEYFDSHPKTSDRLARLKSHL